MYIKLKKLDQRAKIPTKGSVAAAGCDLYAIEDMEIKPGETAMIHTGLAIQIPRGYFGAIYARSGLACKHNLRPANCVGVIDSDYRGEVCVVLTNDRESFSVEHVRDDFHGTVSVQMQSTSKTDSYQIHAGDRVAQLIIQKFEDINFVEGSELDDSDRGEGGFGSTGTN